MATGTGKTVVMAMLIAWHALNEIADPKDRRFADTFLVVTPGITIRDRLGVLDSRMRGKRASLARRADRVARNRRTHYALASSRG